MKKIILQFINRLGYTIEKTKSIKDIKEEEFWDIYSLCKPYTMTSVERMYSLYLSVEYILSNNISGSFVECGVWRGGSTMLIAKMLKNRNLDREIFLYDTFEGMSEPTENDVTLNGEKASILLKDNTENKEQSVWCLADLNDVKRNLKLTGYNEQNLVYVKGKVGDTIPSKIPQGKIAILRLDTDWYESTKHELIHLYPKLNLNGVLIIDDFGHWDGCRKAVEKYFEENKTQLLLNRIDYTGRVALKTSNGLGA